MTNLDAAIDAVRGAASRLDALLAAREADPGRSDRVTDLLRELYAGHLSGIDWSGPLVDLPRVAAAGPFHRYVLWRSPGGLTAAIHRWSAADTAVGDVTIHNHMMSVAGLVLAGTLTHRTFPGATLPDALESWLEGAPLHPGTPDEARIPRGGTYSLAASDLHWAGVAAGFTVTLFVTAPRTYRGNAHIPPDRPVFLKVDGQLAGKLREARSEGGPVGRVLELLRGVAGNPAGDPIAV